MKYLHDGTYNHNKHAWPMNNLITQLIYRGRTILAFTVLTLEEKWDEVEEHMVIKHIYIYIYILQNKSKKKKIILVKRILNYD